MDNQSKENIRLQNYITYLNYINDKLKKFFERQQDYIFCKEGCAKCCKNAHFPYSKIEVQYLIEGFNKLPFELKEKIKSNIKKTLLDKKQSNDKNFKYTCPFLINDKCSVYDYRGIICRTFGLMSINKKGPVKVPFCCYEGLNYSNVLDEKENKVSEEKYKQLGFKEEPLAFNVSYDFLTNPDFEKGFNFSFGDKKALIDWFMETNDSINL